jgi:hypothetical protein
LKIATYVGALTTACAALYGTVIIIGTLIWGNPVAGYPSLLVVMLLLGGLQLITLGAIGEYLGRVFNETKRHPLYFVQEYRPCRDVKGNKVGPVDAVQSPKSPTSRCASNPAIGGDRGESH